MTAPTNPFQNRRWFNQSQPRWLQYATWLLYWSAFWGLITVLDTGAILPGSSGGIRGLLLWAFLIAQIPLAVFGASEMAMYHKRGYAMALIAAFIPAASRLVFLIGQESVNLLEVVRWTIFPVDGSFRSLISFAFEAGLIVCLLHPVSRRYAKVWINE